MPHPNAVSQLVILPAVTLYASCAIKIGSVSAGAEYEFVIVTVSVEAFVVRVILVPAVNVNVSASN